MRKDTSFSDRKLTLDEFSKKYWKEGDPDYIYQFHTAMVEDGRDEREQFIFNDLVAIKKKISELYRKSWSDCENVFNHEITPVKKLIRISLITSIISIALAGVSFGLTMCLLIKMF